VTDPASYFFTSCTL